MKKQLALAVVLGLFLISIANPSPYSMPLAIVYESNETPFLAAADGDESSESITSFSETLADNVLFYPDVFNDGTVVLASSGTAGADEFETYAKTHQFDDGGVNFYYGTGTPDGWVIINFTVPSGTIEGFDYAHFSKGAYLDDHADYMFYDWAADDWVDFGDAPVTAGTGEWRNGTIWDTDYWGTQVSLKVNSTDADSWAGSYIDYAELTFYKMTLADSDHYAESFADVSDWIAYTGNTPTSDGDLLNWDVPDDASYDGINTNSPSLASVHNLYYEFRVRANHSSLSIFHVIAYSSDNGGGTAFVILEPTYQTTAWVTYKGIISTNMALESIRFLGQAPVGHPARFYVDYFRIAPADEMGWQHDGSTTAGVTDEGDAGYDYTLSSDGDILTLTVEQTASADGFARFYIAYDTTATSIDIERDYYQFIEMRYRITVYSGINRIVMLPHLDGDKPTVETDFLWATAACSWTTLRGNLLAMTTNDIFKYLEFYVRTTGVGQTLTIEIDYVGYYSIANNTLTQSGMGVDDYLYVDSGILYSNIDDGYIELNHDPALSVSDTYSVYNLTTSGTAPEFSQYVSSWSTYSDDTRGATTSGTVTDIKLKFDSTEVLSAIKFIEDNTAPDIIDKFVTPIVPDDDESVTLTAVTYDAIEVYEVTINAVVYPAGFNDIDYDLTEQTDNVLWSYEFSTLTAGYYLFQVTANDGANTYSEYIPVTVRVSTIEITTYTFFGASSDFSYMQYSGHINRDCTYNISEWSDSWAKNETHTGSVSEGMFNIAWDKIGVDDTEANFTIVFVSGSLSLTIEGYYGTAYKLLRITEIDVGNLEESQAATNITINFYTNKDVDWFVYDRDDSDAVLASGSSSEGSDYLTWLKDTTPHAHYFAIKWTDGVSNIWFNSSYWTYKENLDSLDQPGKDWDAADTRQTIEFWTTLGAFVAIGGIIAIGISHYKLNKKIGNLPNYQTQ